MQVMETLHMNKGVGETSYAKNSTVQRKIISMAKPIVEEAITQILCHKESIPESLGIADLGCSSGPNALSVISEIIDAVHAKCENMGLPVPELRVSLNDLPTNDFNNLFGSVPELYRKMSVENGMKPGSCFISGVPGSFYGRLFPKKSLHLVHSSSSLHWLSQVPPCLQIMSNHSSQTIINKGQIYISKSSPDGIFEAYLEQFRKDFKIFLESRSAEIVRGGRMVLSFMGRSTSDPTTESAYLWELLAEALMSLVPQGLVEESKVDSFNAPYYAPSVDELLSEINREGSFTVDRIETSGFDWDFCGELEATAANMEDFSLRAGRKTKGERVAKMVRAVVESMAESHFGPHVMEQLFRRYALLVEDHLSKYRTKNLSVIVSLTRKTEIF